MLYKPILKYWQTANINEYINNTEDVQRVGVKEEDNPLCWLLKGEAVKRYSDWAIFYILDTWFKLAVHTYNHTLHSALWKQPWGLLNCYHLLSFMHHDWWVLFSEAIMCSALQTVLIAQKKLLLIKYSLLSISLFLMMGNPFLLCNSINCARIWWGTKLNPITNMKTHLKETQTAGMCWANLDLRCSSGRIIPSDCS